jgi:NAD(P)-dependent dehydrogenase (short-subunit alcohol dehydrogenase family)
MARAQLAEKVALVSGLTGEVGGAVAARLKAAGFSVGTIGDADLLDRSRAVAAAKEVVKKLGPISLLVTCPSLHYSAPFGQMDAERWDQLLQAHLGTTTNACAAVVPAMVAAGRGTVVTTSSWLAYAGIAGESYVAAASGSILAFTKSFALEVAPKGVRVNCVAVGPLDRGVTPADIAETVVFLVDDGDFFVGQVLSAAGGAVV